MPYHEEQDIVLKKGSKGNKVKELQNDLLKLGYKIGTADGDFGTNTDKAVRAFQEAHMVTGVVDHATAITLHTMAEETQAQLPADIPFIASPNFSSRKGHAIDMMVIHFTASGTMKQTVEWFENPAADASAHYVIGKDGKIVQMVKEEDKAWHAGKSEWKGQSNCNAFSIGIELVNWGELRKRPDGFYCWPGDFSRKYQGPKPVKTNGTFWEPYAEKQMRALATLASGIVRRYSISLGRVVGHSDISPGRKTDPGPQFDWNALRAALGA